MKERSLVWVVISTSKILKFFDLKSTKSKEINGLSYAIEQNGHSPKIQFEHNAAVTTLLKNGVPLFINKVDAKNEAVALGLTGFKYLKLSPNKVEV